MAIGSGPWSAFKNFNKYNGCNETWFHLIYHNLKYFDYHIII